MRVSLGTGAKRLVVLSALLAVFACVVARALSAAGGSAPVVITTEKLTITGKGSESGMTLLPFSPVTVTTQKLTITGKGSESGMTLLPFSPVTVTTQRLTITGKR